MAKQSIDSFCPFLWQCYKDLGQSQKARRMCESACSMNVVSKEVDLITKCICICLTGIFDLAFIVSLYKMHPELGTFKHNFSKI